MIEFLRVLAFFFGWFVVLATVFSGIRTFILPRSANDKVSRMVFLAVRKAFNLINKFWSDTYEKRDRIMAYYAPVALLTLVITWLFLNIIGFMFVFWALGDDDWMTAFTTSGSCLLTLGFAQVNGLPQTLIAFCEAIIGLIEIAILISYLPTMYSAFSKREEAVALMEVRAGSPPSAVEMLLRYNRIRGLEKLQEIWVNWELWFVDLGESHTSLAALSFFRSPKPEQSWITAAGAVLDTASLYVAVVDAPRNPEAELCIRAGYLALRHITDFFKIPFDPEPKPTDPISIARSEFDEAYDRLAEGGVPVKPDREQAWRDFAGWRVNYDFVLLVLCALTMAPEAPWSSDRSLRLQRPRQARLLKKG